MNLSRYASLWAAMLCMTACSYTNHFVDDDDDALGGAYSVMSDLDASVYSSWTFVNLKTGETATCPDTGEWYYIATSATRPALPDEPVGIDWHIAFHRYEIRTNGGEALNTHLTDIQQLTSLPDGDFRPDETVNYHTELAVTSGTQYILPMDMSQMMQGNIGYALNATVNRVLSDAVTRTVTGSMPPTLYGITGEVLAIRFPDCSWAALKLTKVYGGRDNGRSGMVSFQYKFHEPE